MRVVGRQCGFPAPEGPSLRQAPLPALSTGDFRGIPDMEDRNVVPDGYVDE
jgi:hypothetical protein